MVILPTYSTRKGDTVIKKPLSHAMISLLTVVMIFGLMATTAQAAPVLTLNQGRTIAREAQKYVDKVSFLAGGYRDPHQGFDNAGFVRYVFAQYNVNVPNNIAGLQTAGQRVNHLQPGDVVFFSNGNNNKAAMAAIYIGNNRFVGASQTFGGVVEQSMSSPTLQRRYLGAVRMHQPNAARSPSPTYIGRRIVKEARKYMGTPYLIGASSATTRVFDCSSFIQRVVADAGLGTLPRTARAQAALLATSNRAQRVTLRQLQPGDLLYWRNLGDHVPPGTVSHTAIYLGNGQIIHSFPEFGVTIHNLSDGFLDPNLMYRAYRILK